MTARQQGFEELKDLAFVMAVSFIICLGAYTAGQAYERSKEANTPKACVAYFVEDAP